MEELKGAAKLLRIFLCEADKLHHKPLCECILEEARKTGLAGATSWKGIMGFGPTSRIRTSKIMDLSNDLPVIIEIIDEEAKINNFIPKLHDFFDQAKSGGMVTVERVEIIRYLHGHP